MELEKLYPAWAGVAGENEYADFTVKFHGEGAAKLYISADTEYAAYLNGEYVAHGQYPDYPYYKCVDEIEVALSGENVLSIRAYHAGAAYDTHFDMEAALAFAVERNGSVIASSRNCLARKSRAYKSGKMPFITPQLGFVSEIDLAAEDDWIKKGEGEGFSPAIFSGAKFDFVPRPVKKCNMEFTPALPKFCGDFLADPALPPWQRMQEAYIKTCEFCAIQATFEICPPESAPEFMALQSSSALKTGGMAVFDLGRECAGYLSFEVESDREAELLVGWGEHLADGRVRTFVGGRKFAFSVKLRRGRNKFAHYFRRLGCRYIQLFSYAHISVHSLGLWEYLYPVREIEKQFDSPLWQRLYEIGRRTLRLCMHEHYEDCPWREQALYGMDSRNQMLFGYGAFNETQMPKASLRIMALSDGGDGLISLTAPARTKIAIPSFSLYWAIALGELAERDRDEKFLSEMLAFAEKIMGVFEKKLTDCGVYSFGGTRYWNFYEWAEGLDGGEIFRTCDIEERPELLNTCLLSMAAKRISEICAMLGEGEKAKKYARLSERATAAAECFYDGERGLYSDFKEEKHFSAYGQAAAILCGAADKERARAIARKMESGEGLIDCTPATLQFKYEAIIKALGDAEFAFKDAEQRFGKMLFSGATSLWETELGAADFGGAGSLCHGWSSVVCWLWDNIKTC